MNTAYFIARKVISSPSHSFSKIIIRMAIGAVALGLAVMIIASSLIAGFKFEVSNKIFGFWGHIHVTDFETTGANPYESVPITQDDSLAQEILQADYFEYPHHQYWTLFGIPIQDRMVTRQTRGGVRQLQSFAQKIGVIKTKQEIEGIILKGVGHDYDWGMMGGFIKKGDTLDLVAPVPDAGIVISEQTASRLELDTGDYFLIYFVKGESQLKKRFQVKAVYRTGLEEYDVRFALVDIRHIQKLNDWDSNEVAGYEIFIDDIQDLHPIREAVYEELPSNMYATTIEDIDPNIFSWLKLQDTNERVIMGMVLVVSLLLMVSSLIILILEHTNMVGILKALGGTDWTVQKVFLYYGAYITIIGLLIGNVLGIGLCLVQDLFGIIQLPEEDYYVSVAPVRIQPLKILAINLGFLVITVFVLLLPSILVRYISPVKAIRFK